jgi:hypothetical protein
LISECILWEPPGQSSRISVLYFHNSPPSPSIVRLLFSFFEVFSRLSRVIASFTSDSYRDCVFCDCASSKSVTCLFGRHEANFSLGQEISVPAYVRRARSAFRQNGTSYWSKNHISTRDRQPFERKADEQACPRRTQEIVNQIDNTGLGSIASEHFFSK